MEILSFDIIGKFAHFRKFYGNNSALTYSIPPRTTITGILAAIAGLDKESYYLDLNSEKLDIAVFSTSAIKKVFYRLNTLMIKGLKDFRGRLGHTQTPFEVISGYKIDHDFVKYTIYLRNKESEVYQQIKEHLLNRKPIYSLYLGLAGFLAWIENPSILRAEEKFADQQIVELDSTANAKQVSQIFFEQKEKFDFVEEEKLPADFDTERRVIKFNDLIFTLGGKKLNVRISGRYYVLNNEKKIQFML